MASVEIYYLYPESKQKGLDRLGISLDSSLQRGNITLAEYPQEKEN